MKHCPLCRTEKPNSEFVDDSFAPDGLKYCCKICDNTRRRNLRAHRYQNGKTNRELLENQRQLLIAQGLKLCPACKSVKQTINFSKNRARKDGFADRCKICQSHSTKNWYRTHPKNYTGKQNKRLYGLTPDQYAAMRLAQNDRCAICHVKMVSPCIDHCHITGKIRALLCRPCNLALGYLRDSEKFLRNALNYIRKFS
jgi:hypothetical protein